MTNSSPQIVLGSTSPFRKELLERLNVDFITDSPDIDETPLINEPPKSYVERLAIEKAKAVALRHPNSLIIGSDQCSLLNDEIRGKPHTHENAIKQLSESSGNRVSFLTALCLYDSNDHSYQLETVPFHVNFRELTATEIEAYLLAEQPYSCAGSFKSEGLGITLFKSLQGDDPTALIGLPLIKLSGMLRQKNIKLP